MSIDVVSSSNQNENFPKTDHWFHVSEGFEDGHITQIVKKLCHKYITIRLHTYDKLYIREVINNSS